MRKRGTSQNQLGNRERHALIPTVAAQSVRMRCRELSSGSRKRRVEFKGGSLHDGFGGFDGFGGSGKRLALLLLVLQNEGQRGNRGGFDGFFRNSFRRVSGRLSPPPPPQLCPANAR